MAASVSQTGRFAQLGTEVGRGYTLAVEMLNEGGGIKGREVELILRDDRSDAQGTDDIYGEFAGSRMMDALLHPPAVANAEARFLR